MSVEDLITVVFCQVDDLINGMGADRPKRERGRNPQLSGSEVITMEIVGELMGLDADKGIWKYFHTHWRHLFPRLTSRTPFVRHILTTIHLDTDLRYAELPKKPTIRRYGRWQKQSESVGQQAVRRML